MFKLPGIPTPQSEVHDLADFAEWLAWKQGRASSREILAAIGRLDDNDHNIGCDDNADELADDLDEVMNEIERRQTACNGAYPFSLGLAGTVLENRPPLGDSRAAVYYYLLLATRLNMQNNRTHEKIDGTLLMEELGEHVLGNYLGGRRMSVKSGDTDGPNFRRAMSMVFGTRNPGRFPDKVRDLCSAVGEGGAFRALDTASVDAQDDKLDVVALGPFSDQKPSQLVLFGQCKTGTSWEGQVTQLQPEAFIRRWMRDPFLLTPIRTFLISEAPNHAKWCGTCLYAGLLFDRCRIIDFCADLNDDLLSRITTWTDAAKQQLCA